MIERTETIPAIKTAANDEGVANDEFAATIEKTSATTIMEKEESGLAYRFVLLRFLARIVVDRSRGPCLTAGAYRAGAAHRVAAVGLAGSINSN